MMLDVDYQTRARDHWGEALPEWVAVLAGQADRTSLNKTAKQLGLSITLISRIISNDYPHSTENAETRVRGVLMKETITCPALGEIGKATCQDWRGKAEEFSSHNALRVRMYRACRKCAFNPKKEAAA